MNVRLRRPDGSVDVRQVSPGSTLLDVLKESGQQRVGICGGKISCGTCRVLITPPWHDVVPPPGRTETRLLSVLRGAAPHHRCACQIRLDQHHDGLEFAPAPIT